APPPTEIYTLSLHDALPICAEAKLRKGESGPALADVNFVRASRTARPERTPAPLAAMDLDILYRERGFELYWEGFRRTDQIRFGDRKSTRLNSSHVKISYAV